jgi:C4-dicarboxylate-specific signal transduction histidine kinase
MGQGGAWAGTAPAVDGGLSSALERVRANIDQLLAIESRAQRKCRSSQAALLHAGKMASVGRMVAGINHEIKRPLASIRLLTECSLAQLERGDTARVAENLQRVVRVVDLVTDLSRRLEAFSRKVEPCIGPLSVAQAVNDALAVLAPQLQTSRCELRVAGSAAPVLADADRLTFVLVNLVDNAVAAGGGLIEVVLQTQPQQVTVRVRDHGPGLSEEALAHLFEDFFTTKPVGKGLGLGLALAAEMMREMGGSITGANHPAGGAEFTLALPRAAAAA